MTDTFTIGNLLWALSFVAIVVILSLWKDYRIIRDNVTAVIKMLVQLFAMGFVLVAVVYLEQNVSATLGMFLVWCVIGVMLVNAVITTSNRGKGIPHIHAITFVGITMGSAIVLLVLFIAGIAQYTAVGLIPFVGSIVGNALTKNSQGLERLTAEFKARVLEMETILTLGGTIQKATTLPVRKTIQSIFIPINDSMRNAGFFLPGAAVGLIITGTPPLEAMIFQSVMFLAWCGGAILTSSIVSDLVVRHLVTKNHQLRYEIIHALVLPDREKEYRGFHNHTISSKVMSEQA